MRGPPFKLAPHTTLFSRVWGQLLVKRGPVSRTRAEDCTLNPIPPILVMTLSGPTRLGPGRSSQLTRSARALPPLNLMMKLSGPTKLRAAHQIRIKGDYGQPRFRGAARVSRWWADGGARLSFGFAPLGRVLLSLSSRDKSPHAHLRVAFNKVAALIWYCVRVGWGLWPAVSFLTPILGWLRGAPRVRKRPVPPDGRLSGGATAVP